MRTLTTLDDLDAALQECDVAAHVSDDRLRDVFKTFQMDFSAELPKDPFDPAYAAAQMRIYERVAGRRYELGNEASVIDPEQAVRRPFPYATGSCLTTGNHLGAIGFLLRMMRLAPGARVLEFGPGWGNTTIALAQLGFDVTAVDIEPRFCAAIRGRAASLGVPVRVINADFFWMETAGEQFDAVVFFECFHHCSDHMRLLNALHGTVKDGGHAYFGCEPIIEDYPVPWGVRMDGESLWAIRKFGWLELGFSGSYFRQALRRTGWSGRRHASADLGWVSVWDAWKRSDTSLTITAADPRLHTMTGTKEPGGIVLHDAEQGYALFGPYVTLMPGRYVARVMLGSEAAREGRFVLEASASHGNRVLASAPGRAKPPSSSRWTRRRTTLSCACSVSRASQPRSPASRSSRSRSSGQATAWPPGQSSRYARRSGDRRRSTRRSRCCGT